MAMNSEVRERSRLALSKLKQAIYAPLRDLQNVVAEEPHDERRTQLIKLAESLTQTMDQLEYQLNR